MKKLLLLIIFSPALASYAQNWEKNYDYVDDCVCGLSQVKKNGKVGYVNKKGVEIIKPQYDEGLPFNEGYTAVKKGTNGYTSIAQEKLLQKQFMKKLLASAMDWRLLKKMAIMDISILPAK